MKNWLRFWKNRRPHDLESLLRAARPEPPAELVKAIAGQVRPQPAHRRTRPLRVGRTVLVAGAAALLVAAVSSAAGLSLTHNVLNTDVIHFGSSGPSAAAQYTFTPQISSISPTEGTVGTTVVITGTGFVGATAVSINGQSVGSHFTVVDDTEIDAVVQSGTGASGHVTVTNSGGSASSAETFLFAPSAPSNTTAPHITGTQNLNGLALAFVGNTLSADTGTWSGSPYSFAYQWEQCDSSYSSCSAIGGATSSTYTLQASDLGQTVKVFVTAHNAAGDTTASNSNFDLRGNVGAPNPTADNASISGTPEVGTALTANNGSWNGQGGVGAITFNYQWYQCGATAPSGPGDCTQIGGATSQSYTPGAGDSGHFLAVHIGGSNTYGSNGWSLFTATNTAVDGPTVSGFNPSSGAPGTVVTISGSHFTGATGVQFNGTSAASFTVNSSTSISALVPAGATSGPVSVTTSIGTGTSVGSFTIVAVPVVSSFSPASGGVGTTVTISGSNFTGATAVKFNATSTSAITVNGDGTQITVNVPTGATTGKISVITSVGTGVSSTSFTVLALPTVTSFLPNSATAGTSVVINGSNFVNVTGVAFNGTPAITFTPNAATKITATVPAGATTGHVSVTTAAGTGTSTATFTVIQRPEIDSFTPTTQQPGGKVTLFGSHFSGVAGTTGVKLGTTTIPSIVNSDTQITATLPASMALGTFTWSVTNAAGMGDSTLDTPAQETVATLGVPSAFTFAPPEGPSGTTVTLTANAGPGGFVGITSVTFNGKPATVVSVSGDGSTIDTQVPAGATTGKIGVANAKGTQLSSTNFVVDQLPKVVSFTPGYGKVGNSIIISGSNLSLAGHTTTVNFGSSGAVTPTSINATGTSLTAMVPADASTGPISVNVSGVGTGNSTATFFFVQPPTISSFTPSVGKGGTVVTVTGTHFLGGPLSVKFGTMLGTGVKVLTDTSLTVAAPAQAVGTSVNLSVTNIADTAVSTDTFSYGALPTVTSFSPTHGPANTQRTSLVTISGSNFTGASSVLFGAKPGTIMSLDDTSTPNTITAFVPAGATTGQISVITPAGTGKSSTSFVVDPLPTVTSFTPAPPAGVDPSGSITINGTNFRITNTALGYSEAVDGVSVNGVPVASFNVVSATQITAVLPDSSSGISTGPITVTNSNVGSATSKLSLIVRAAPTLDSFTPSSGIAGTKVTLTGSGFAGTGTGGLTVTFNGDDPLTGNGPKTATSLLISSDTTAVATVPVGATSGTITVHNSQGDDTSTDEFTVAAKPTLASFEPSSGPASSQATTVVDIQGSHLSGTTAVKFGTLASPFISVNDDGDITAVVPAGAVTGKITVVNPAGSITSASNFVVDGVPVVTSISPTRAAVGDQVTINGRNLVGEMDGTQFPNDTSVDFHGFFGATVESITSTQIVVDVPFGATTGPLLVSNVWGETAVSPLFTLVAPPTIDDFFNEFTGDQSGKKGQPVVIFGSGFTGTTSVRFNGTSAPFTVVADWEIIATVPSGATTGYITVANPADSFSTSSLAPGFQLFTVLP